MTDVQPTEDPQALYEQEDAAIQAGFTKVHEDSVKWLRRYVVSTINGHQPSSEIGDALKSLAEDYLTLATRRSVLNGEEEPERPAWMDPA